MDTPTTEEVFDVLRRVLRERGLTYRNLAQRIGMSESGVKKLFTADDASLSRLLDICRSLEIEVEEVLRIARRGPLPPIEPTEAQANAFHDDPRILWLLWALGDADGDVDATRERVGLDSRAMRKLLGQLARLDLVTTPVDGRVRVLTRGRRWTLGRALGRPVMDPVHDAVLASARHIESTTAADDADAPPTDLSMGRLRLRPQTVLELKEAMHAVLYEFALREQRERVLWPSEERLSIGVLGVIAPFDWADVIRGASA